MLQTESSRMPKSSWFDSSASKKDEDANDVVSFKSRLDANGERSLINGDTFESVEINAGYSERSVRSVVAIRSCIDYRRKSRSDRSFHAHGKDIIKNKSQVEMKMTTHTDEIVAVGSMKVVYPHIGRQ